MGSDIKRARVRVTGMVQGVSYRASTQEEARARSLVGWVRNERDGAVLLEVQGPAADVDDLIAWCRRGPALADVDTVTVEAIAVDDAARGFDIRR
jgi:acylphosphatase